MSDDDGTATGSNSTDFHPPHKNGELADGSDGADYEIVLNMAHVRVQIKTFCQTDKTFFSP